MWVVLVVLLGYSFDLSSPIEDKLQLVFHGFLGKQNIGFGFLGPSAFGPSAFGPSAFGLSA